MLELNVMSSNWSSTGPPLYQDGLVVCRGLNTLVHLAVLCHGGPILAPDLGLFWSSPIVSFFWGGCGSLHLLIPQIDPAF